MIVVGLTGRIGAGKSTVARLFADHGAVVVDADRIAHEVLREPEVTQMVVDRFGPEVLAVDGSVDRRKLAKQVFGPTATHAAALEALEAIIHPRVLARIDPLLEVPSAAGGESPSPVVVLDVPLLAKSGLGRRCTHLLEVVCDEPVRRARLAARGWDASEIEARDAAWERNQPTSGSGTDWKGRSLARFLDASGDVRYTSGQVEQFLREIAGERRARGP